MSWLQLDHQVVTALAPRPVQGELPAPSGWLWLAHYQPRPGDALV